MEKRQNDLPPPKTEDFNATLTLIQSREQPERGLWIKGVEATVNLVKAVIWPALILYVFFALHVPIDQILSELPEKLSEAQKISVGSLSLEVQAQAKRTGGMELAVTLQNLSPKAVALLININRAYWAVYSLDMQERKIFGPSPERVKLVAELQSQNLLVFSEDPLAFDKFLKTLQLTKTSEGRTSEHGEEQPAEYKLTRDLTEEENKRLQREQIHLTELGASAFDSVVAAVVEQLRSNSKNLEGHN